MTLVERPVAVALPLKVEPPVLRRLWRKPLSVHVAALALVLVALLPVVGASSSFSADEGAAIIQAHALSSGRGWLVPHPLPAVDPTGRNYPLELSAAGTKGTAPFGKHPFYAVLLAGVDRVGGHTAMVLLSLAGTVAIAAAAAALARRLDPSLSRLTIWVVGLLSPLLFDSYLVIAHTLGAALATLAVLSAVVAVERRSRCAALAVMPCVAIAVLLRTEASLLALGLAAAGAAAATAARRPRWPALAVSGASLAGAAVAITGERAWIHHIVGAAKGLGSDVSAPSGGFLHDRLHAFVLTWLKPGYGDKPAVVELALVVMAAALLLAVCAARGPAPNHRGVVVRSAVAAVAAWLAVLTVPTNLVPGLLPAFPVGLAGLAALRRQTLMAPAARLALVTFAVFSAGVVATQYAVGGGSEWGGRYFAIGLPIVVPVLLLALRDAGLRLDTVARRRAIGALVGCSLALTVMSVSTMRATHRTADDLLGAIDRVSEAANGPPVLVSTSPIVPRLAWRTFDQQRWLLAPPPTLPDTVRRLRAAGVDRFTLVTRDLAREARLLPDDVRILERRGRPDQHGWQVLLVDPGG